jgi:DNA-binding NtrC family response regulator
MREAFALLDRAARSEATVLLLGASGTGKDVAARAIHDASPRADEPFVAIHCGAIAHDLLEAELFGHERGAFTGAHAARPGLFERAGRGTVFLDEIAAAPGRVQVGLLRVLQERQVRRIGARRPTATPARIIAATNADLDDALAAGRFRQDLYYRLAALIVRLPSLAERREDIPVLVAEICRRLGERDRCEVSVSPRALQRLASFEWRGNVRELEHVLEQAALVASGGTIRERDILALEQAEPAPVRTLLEVERDHIREVLRACGGNRARAARLLDVPRATLYRKMRQLGIRESEEDGGADEPTDPERSPDAIEAESRSPATE